MANRKTEAAEATRRTLIKVSARMFAQRGFEAVPAEEIVAAAKVTRGALYHHFEGGKEGLFGAVVAEAMREVHGRLAAAAAGARSPLDAVERGVREFLRACAEPGYQRVLLIDGPAVLGWHAWRALDLQFGLGLLLRGLEGAAKAGQLSLPDIEMATHLLAGALIDGAMLIGKAKGNSSVRGRVEAAVLRLLHGLAAPSGKVAPAERARRSRSSRTPRA